MKDRAHFQRRQDRIIEDFFVDCDTIGEANAVAIARERMHKLGFDHKEINQQLAEALS